MRALDSNPILTEEEKGLATLGLMREFRKDEDRNAALRGPPVRVAAVARALLGK